VTDPIPIHIKPTAELAPRVLLPGDPGRALLFAQSVLSDPAMFNHHRGLWGYTGRAPDGGLLTVQSTGMGGPSAAIVVAELVDLGATQFLRVGTCGALAARLSIGDLVVAVEALAADGTSRALGADERVAPDSELTDSLLTLSAPDVTPGPVVSTDLFYDGPEREEEAWVAAGAVAVEMESAALFALAARRGVRAASLLLVTDLLLPHRVRIGPEALEAGERRLGELATQALAATATA
jgi:DeoD family purine-nucleoside phosphorylase